MEEIKVDTKRIRECGDDILKLVEELKLTYNEMFTRFEKIPTETREWVGPTAEKYSAAVLGNKPTYMNFAKDLYKYGEYLINCANAYDEIVNQVRR